MAVDPKQVIARNKALIVCYVVAIVPIVLWFVLVVGGVQGGATNSYKRVTSELRSKKSDLEGFSRRIDEMLRADAEHPATDPVYTEKHRLAYESLNTALKDQQTKLKDVVRARDEALEKWFDPWGTQANPPAPGDMDAKINAEIENYKKKYGDFIVDPLNKNLLVWKETVVQGKQREIQKKWWIQDRILTAVAAGDGKAERIVNSVEFPAAPPPPPAPPGETPKKPLTSTIPVKFAVLATMRNVPKLTRALLAQDIVFKLVRVKTELAPFAFAIKKGDLGFAEPFFVNPTPLPLYEQSIYMGTLAGSDKLTGDEEQILPEPRVKVSFELEAVDFDMEAIDPKPAAAPEKKEEEK